MTNVSQTVPPPNELRPIKPPIRMPGEWAWLWWTLGAMVLAGVIAGLWLRRRRKQELAATPVVVVPPHIRARQKLAEALLFISDPDRFCTAVSHTLRVYLEERFRLHAPERTTEEFLIELQASPALNEAQKKSLQHFLQSCDLVKFARFEPTETVLRDLHDSALRLVDETQFDPIAIPIPAMAAASANTRTPPNPPPLNPPPPNSTPPTLPPAAPTPPSPPPAFPPPMPPATAS